jgi:hypothetical protein
VSYFWYCSMSYFLNCSAWKSAIYDREQVKKYDTEWFLDTFGVPAWLWGVPNHASGM